MITKEQAYKTLEKLIERFDDHIEEYKRGHYNETQTRVDYINPFFKALGWDIDNEQGLAEAYREVIHEDKIKIGKTTKAPDYCFTVYGQRKFFVDAKKPSINIKDDISPAYQVRRYGWSARLPIAIVTDFEEFSIYDCSKKPNQNDRSSVARIQYLTYKDYLKEFDFIWETFSKDRILKGSFDKFVQSDTKKRGTATVDNEFLKEIDEWRKYLATTIALRNATLSEDEINYAVQKIIDRILFLRICEDRGVEQYGNLNNAIKKGDLYKNLFELFHIADKKYNSGLFDFNEDKITPNLIIDNKVIKNIIQELYYPRSPFEFSVLPADILGSVYEQFLGKTIRLTKAHHAKIEEKPEVRKAGGVYYTPKYIVDYIVENTVGKLIEGKTPKQIEKIKICDPACGSGSFLIGAYQYLLDWHLKYYIDNPPRKKKDNPVTPDGNLTTAEKKRILVNNIFGVDIDAQAVEVTKLNLLLKALEGETQASISKQLTFFNERVLPNLGDNIKCGNSLIGNDFYDNQLDLFPNQIKKINAFDWETAFLDIFKNGGFDVVIGNPPYIRIQTLNEFSPDSVDFYRINYNSASKGNYDIYVLFIEKGLQLLNKKGKLGYILPHKFFNSQYGEPIRKLLTDGKHLDSVVHFGSEQIFKEASTYTCLLFLTKSANELIDISKVSDIDNWQKGTVSERGNLKIKILNHKPWTFIIGNKANVFERINNFFSFVS
ncbi:MAG: N-6 DNA methylase [Bacteroidetes bacterium]|nr:N-6 DNA methylase [Bacteroidota bacterium]